MSILQFFNKTNNLGYQTAILRYRLLPSILSLTLLLTLLVSFQVGAALTPSPIIVDSQVKVSFSEFEFNQRSNTSDVRAKLTNQSFRYAYFNTDSFGHKKYQTQHRDIG